MSVLKYLLRAADVQPLAARWDIPIEDVTSFLEQALTAGKHNEFLHLSQSLSMDEASVRNDV